MNYIGSKYSLMDFLDDTIIRVAGEAENGKVFADLFAGTGTVGSWFRKKGFNVIANDIQHYSYVLNKHFIENVLETPEIDLQRALQITGYLNQLTPTEGFIYNNYCEGSGSGRNYFTDTNGKKCDSIRSELEKLKQRNEITESEYYHILASLLNSIDKYANTASVYGAFLKHIKKSAAKEFRLELLPIISGEIAGKVYNRDVNDLIKHIEGDILYLDPPYNERQYCTNYHVLETISRYDNPKLHGLTGLRDYTRERSDFCSKKTVQAAFDSIVKQANFNFIFLSYNNEGLMPIETIRQIMERYGRYEVFTKEYRRFKADKPSSRNHKAETTTEYIHCLIR